MSFHLYIMRHAKSDWSGPDTADHDRPINKRGQKNAMQIGQWMQENNYIPQKIISSTALRAKQTIELVSNQFVDYDSSNILYDKMLYLAEPYTLLELIKLYKDELNSLMLVAHNPGMERLVNTLQTEEYKGMTTANLAIFEYPDSQFNPEVDKGKLIEFIKPKELK